ncbi:XdhC family protein [Aquimarina pacifica]|uniref:XdhC family protein n=1 Tax=Aquimarina pacifica TaxID=1296415 RepID=UPI000470ABFA|nr:XdhC/CoxI family protein [Aquimarina pacifica]
MTHEFKEIITSYKTALEKGIPAVMATVVDVDGSSYRRPGVGMLLLQNGKITGAVSGGCVEKEVWRQAQSVFSTGQSRIMIYDGKYRLGCEGTLFILIEPFSIDKNKVLTIQNYLKLRIPFTISSWYTKNDTSKSIGMGSKVTFESNEDIVFSNKVTGDQDISLLCFSRRVHPCFRLIIVGVEHDAIQLSALASITGWEVIIVGSSKNGLNHNDFPGALQVLCTSPEEMDVEGIDGQTAVVLMNHNFAKDLLYLRALKDTTPAYIGLLGPAKRREKLLSAFIEYFPEVSDHFLDLIHGPAGLNIGAETPQEIAISIIAEILAVTREQNPISLQEKKGAIHDQSKQKEVRIISDSH